MGVGGMGSVYRARDLHFPNVVKLVAVKEIANLAPDPKMRQTIIQNFEREANILATLTHPSIPSVFDYFSSDDRSYLVLEYINGNDLETVISDADSFLSTAQVVGWAIELCDVLSFLHTHKPDPIIFRDMKPSNVMIDSRAHIMLVDFGIAKQFQAGQKGTMIGTEGYSPPEQYRGEATYLADIYSLGATIHHLLTKRDPRMEPPFSFQERSIREINSEVSAEIEAVVMRALAYETKERFQSANEMKDALVAAARQTGLLTRIATKAATPIKMDGIKPVWKFKCEDEVRGTPAIFENTLYIGCYDNNLYALDSAEGKFKWKYPTDGGVVTKPAIAESNIFFGSEDQRLHVISARGGKIIWSHFAEAPLRSSPRIAEGHVFFGSDDGTLYALNIVSGRMIWEFQASSAIRSTPYIDGENIFVGSENGDFYCLDFKGKMRWQFRAKRAITSSPLVKDNTVYFTSLDNHLYAVDASNGWVLWKFRLGKGSISSPAILDNLIYAGAADGFIYAVDINTAKEAWRFRTEHQVASSPVVYRDAVYCASIDSHLYCLEASNGQLRWKFATEGPITGSPLVYDDMVYIGSTDHQIYALLA